MSEVVDKLKVPKLRFPEFEGEWREATVDWFLIRKSIAVDVDNAATYREIGVRSHGKGIFHKLDVSGQSLGAKRVFEVVPGSLVLNIVFAWEQALALTSEAERGFIASHRFPMFQGRQGRADSRFARYFFIRPRGRWLLELASPGGAGRNKTLGQDEFRKLKVRWPTQFEQSRISDYLDAIDQRVDVLTRKREALKGYKSGIMQQLFSLELRFTRYDGSPFSDWQEMRLGEVCSSIKDGSHATHPDCEDGGYWLLSAKNVTQGRLKFGQGDRQISKVEFEKISKTFPLRRNDILLTIVGSIGRVAIFYGIDNVAFQRSVAFMRIKRGVTEYFLQYFQGFNFQRELKRRQVVSAQPGVYLGDLAKIACEFPALEEQQKIADFLSALDVKIDAVARQIDAMQRFKKGLLQQMFV